MRRSLPRRGFTLVELLVVIAILGVLVGLLVPAVQKVREVAADATDKNNLQQLGYGCINFNMQNGQFPIGYWKDQPTNVPPTGNRTFLGSNFWHIRSFIEQKNAIATTPIKLIQSPLDSRDPFVSSSGGYGLTSYAFVEGIDSFGAQGIVIAGFDNPPPFGNLVNKVRPQDITDGQSTTLMIGPRPPSADRQWGLWAILIKENPIDTQMGVANSKSHPEQTSGSNGTGTRCPQGPAFFGPGDFNNNCDVHHFWSPSDIGGNFCMGDGSVRFFSYGTAPEVMLGAATRAGHENIDLDQ